MGFNLIIMNLQPIKINFEKNVFSVLDQKLLPFQIRYIDLKTIDDVYNVIKNMNVRGAPLIGIVALIGLYLSNDFKNLQENMLYLQNARPTAVNIFNYFSLLKDHLSKTDFGCYKQAIKDFIIDIIKLEEEKNYLISKNGFDLINELIKKNEVNILTHCNTGSLATIGLGTALGIIKFSYQEFKKIHKNVFVWVDETRPYLQGSRLTAWELSQENIPFKIITDNMAAYVMFEGLVDVVCVGADRISRNGDVANKIGTLNLAILCKYFNIPFIVAAPSSSVDFKIPDLKNLSVEQRNKEEVLKINNYLVTNPDYDALNPSFDITPSHLVSYIVLENGIYKYPYSF